MKPESSRVGHEFASETSVTRDTNQRRWAKSTLIKKPTPKELAQITGLEGDTIIVDDSSADREPLFP
jgi:hypothetical protein